MPSPPSKKPMNWEDYEYGRSSRHGSETSLGSHVQFDATASPPTSGRLNIPPRNSSNTAEYGDLHDLRHRRSSISMRINSLAQVGGVNSLENFARSWSRAAGFVEIPARKPSFILSKEDEEIGRKSASPTFPAETRSLLRQQLDGEGTSSEVFEEESTSHLPDEEALRIHEAGKPTPEASNDVLDQAPYLSSPYASSSGGIYGSLSSRVNEPLMRHAGDLYHNQQLKGQQVPDNETEPLLVKVVEQKDGQRVQIVVGQSTLPQTVFNSVNVLVGVGLLSLPLGIKYSGWLIGMLLLLFATVTTRYTAGILAKCLDIDTSLVGFADIAWKAFGTRGSLATGCLFTIELLAACVALVVLFGDSFDALIPGWGVVSWKVFGGIVLIPLGFVPLRFLSFTSVLGITACLGTVTLIFVDGLIKPQFPGSLRDPAPTAALFPQRWSTLPLSFGLLMSPWGGHSVFPNIYRDMRHPWKYNRAINYTYIFTYTLDVLIAVAGFAMFGQQVRDEVSSNILLTKGYPHAISVCIVVFIGIIPLTKIPLNVAPINNTVERFFGLDPHQVSQSSGLVGLSGYTRGFLKYGIRVLTVVVIVVLAILVPSFDTVMALLGSAMAFSICIVLPLAFHLKLFGNEIGKTEKGLNWFLIIICSIMGIVGTVWVFLPKHVRENLDRMA
ncbi:hypothetical protein ABVK25_004492 [Lepraria finkii]|uniref:Amino acid transporter transmembrane domain-containing protein n=1 Tax=Lepraria finkii TaxID=1340010 RepID=A0ABR4BBC2_9LECA